MHAYPLCFCSSLLLFPLILPHFCSSDHLPDRWQIINIKILLRLYSAGRKSRRDVSDNTAPNLVLYQPACFVALCVTLWRRDVFFFFSLNEQHVAAVAVLLKVKAFSGYIRGNAPLKVQSANVLHARGKESGEKNGWNVVFYFPAPLNSERWVTGTHTVTSEDSEWIRNCWTVAGLDDILGCCCFFWSAVR